MTKRMVSLAAACLMLTTCAAPLTGCQVSKPGEGGDAEEGGDLKIVSFYNIWPDDETTAVGAAIKAYKSTYGANVTYKQYDYDVYNNKLVQMVAGGNAPDIIVGYWGDMPRMAAIELIQPVDAYVDVGKQNLQGLMDSYTWKGKHYAASVQQVQTPLLWYRKSLMEKEGIDQDPYALYKAGKWNWDTFLELGKKMTKDTDGDGEPDQWGFNTNNKNCFRWSNSAPMVRTNDNGTFDIAWKEEPYIRAIKFMQQIRFTDVIMPQDMSKYDEDFGTGKLAMSYGTFEMLGRQVKNYKVDPDDIGLAPFPTGPDFDGHYYAITNLMTIANGATNPKGAGRLCEMICEKERELFGDDPNLGNPEYSKYLTEEHMTIIREAINNARVCYDGGWGSWDPKFIMDRGLLYDNKDVVTTLDTVEPMLQAAINDLLSSTVQINTKFETPATQDFENGLGIFTADKAGGAGTALTSVTDEVVSGKASLKLASDDVAQVLAYTDTAKLRFPTYKVYKVKMDYKILSATEAEKADFALTTRTLTNLDNEDDQTGWVRFEGKAGDTGTVEAEFELMKDDVADYVLVIMSGVNAGSVSVDNITITDVTPAE